MNITRFVERRKELGYSQSDLAKGICTQATISKFENNGKMISTKILSQLCQRLGISISEIFPNPIDTDSEVQHRLQTAEFDLITTEYDEAIAILQSINFETIINDTTKMTYLIIKGYGLALSNQGTDEAVFCFDQILNGYDEPHNTIYSQLAYVGLGIAYQQVKNLDKAQFYFAKMPKQLAEHPTDDVADVWKTLTMLFYTGSFYALIKDLKTSDSLLTSLIHLSSNRHVTFYVARAQFQLALNIFTDKAPPLRSLPY
ncbi:helix-turn-helix domain-containing protein [Lentilactobacillus kisonensis]|uniref:helix-turn-helix domain-containing protein n=1 Tax=Lentilactobacillus kisonensis TaxID=481722 RepID=UPI000B1BA81F|nr:helix-turn-helix transcriptional regulator [Lentilactobacillus kisonensis]